MFDYIIVGAGSAGCLLANRLSEDPNNRVLLLEAGVSDKSPMIHMPGGCAHALKSDQLNWKFNSTPQQGMNRRVMPVPRGKTLGGSSAVNGMVYIRGHAKDYDDWAEAGNEGWSYKEILPYFKKSEGNCRGESKYHGGAGELKVSDPSSGLELFSRWVDAGARAGMSRNDDFNGEHQDGVGLYQSTIDNGVRCSSANAFLKPARMRPNLTIRTESEAVRLIIEKDRACAVEYSHRGSVLRASASREIIVSCGAIKSPHLLQMSGIGHPDDLAAVGMDTKVELPGVGGNLQEHLDLKLNWSINQPIALNKYARFPSNILVGLEYLWRKTGLAAKCGIEGGAFWRSNDDEDRPDIQFHFIPANMEYLTDPLPKQHGVTLRACNLRPYSRGSVKPASNNPLDKPLVDFAFLDNERDWNKMLSALDMGREIMHAHHWNGLVDGVITPGLESTDEGELREMIKNTSDTVYHPVGTCKMGNDDLAVVGPDLKVHGVEGLRICDASIMPTIIGGNTNAPTIMVAEKCADMVLSAA
ncbi:choline dehydrogenase [Pseudomaricurvus alkylphenolicus]|uniref:GMC family oxidoreductase n=1 Tax=Pseudomaricurvus alkylphenolicus TaxID=1306991 RepID=UPI0014239A87|nr:choline dehydrogenase [Pseudomaricurvus alkylphenolicus]NIB42122.1 choline dehydrogenase [Pseudomaricurvus alkylphenolicus]